MQRQVVERAAADRRRRMASLRKFGLLGILLLAVVGGAATWYLGEATKPGQGVSQQPSSHIADVTTPHDAYNTDPPTSGPHVKDMLAWGVKTAPVEKEKEVHNLEDGGVVISYRPDLDKATVARLAAITESYSSYLLMAPSPGLSTPIALTAWNRIDRLTSLDEARIKRFIDAFQGKDHHRDSGS